MSLKIINLFSPIIIRGILIFTWLAFAVSSFAKDYPKQVLTKHSVITGHNINQNDNNHNNSYSVADHNSNNQLTSVINNVEQQTDLSCLTDQTPAIEKEGMLMLAILEEEDDDSSSSDEIIQSESNTAGE